MEDFDFIRRAGKHGKVKTCLQPVITSARRWENVRLIKTMLINQVIVIGFYLGISHHSLRKLYKTKSARSA